MSETKHTPGPWVKDYGNTTWHIKSIANPIEGTPTVAVYHGAKSLTESEKEANAHLIAAAPELYEALEDALKVINECIPDVCDVPVPGVAPKIRNALAKARGES